MTLLAIFGCAPGTRELPPTLEGFGFDATIDQTTERRGAGGVGYSTDHVRVMLQDQDGRALEREDLRVQLNDAPLSMRAAHGNFYDRHPFYRLDDAAAYLPPDEECRFTILRPDGTHHAAGVVRTPKLITPAQFEFPEIVSRRDPIAIQWTSLAEPVELVIFRSHALTDFLGETVLESGGPNDPDALRRTIGPGLFRRTSGRLEIPSSFLADHDGRRVRAIGVEISVTHEGTVQGAFSKESMIRATRRLVFYAELAD